MLGALKRRWKTPKRPNSNYPNESDKDEPQDMLPPRYIAVQRGKISLEPPNKCVSPDSIKDREVLEARIAELEDALARLQVQVNNSQCNSPILEKELKEQLENMNKTMRTKDRRTMQACREHKTLQARFVRQENSLHLLSHENKSLQQRVRQYEICLDDVMRKVVDAIVAEDSLREEVSMLKNRVRDLEAQNAVLSTSTSASPAKGKDEGYCTMSSGQPQPSVDSHLADLPEEPELWLVSASGAGSAEMEEWSMSQEELGTGLDDENSEWIWNTANFISTDTQTEEITALLQDQIVYSDDEEITCKDFTRDFYKLVNIKSDSTRSLQSAADADQSDSSSECGRTDQMVSPTPSEAGRAQVLSCTSSESSEIDNGMVAEHHLQHLRNRCGFGQSRRSTDLVQDVLAASSRRRNQVIGECNGSGGRGIPVKAWRRSTGWRRIAGTEKCTSESGIPLPISPVSPMKTRHHVKSPPPVPVRRTHAS